VIRLLLMLSFAIGPAAAAPAQDEKHAPPPKPTKAELERHWDRYRASGHRSTDDRAALLAGGGESIDVLLGMIGGDTAALSDKELEAAVTRLGDDDFDVREKATADLIKLMPGIAPRLERFNDHEDAEIQLRIERVLASKTINPDDPIFAEYRALREAGTHLFEMHMPIDTLRVYARDHIDRIAALAPPDEHWARRPEAPLLASLRSSDDEADRKLLVTYLEKVKAERKREMALHIMRNGLRSRSIPEMPEHWEKLPKHDYRPVALAYLDVEHPAVFAEALAVVGTAPAYRDQVVQQLRDALAKTDSRALKVKIEATLYRLEAQ